MPGWISIPLAVLVVALVAPRRGRAQQSAYFKAGGKCMVKPHADQPAYEIPCEQWERERVYEERGFFEEKP